MNLTEDNLALAERMDDLEQYCRRPSTWAYGIPAFTPGNTDEKLIHLLNVGLELR